MPTISRSQRSPTGCALHRIAVDGHARGDASWSPSTPAPAPSAPRRTGWPTSSSTWCSRAARSTPPTATSTRPPRGSARCSTPTPATTWSPSTSPPAPQRALEAADLLTDFVARPRIDAEELDRERGVVVQEIARADDQPSVMAEHLIDEAVFGDHPLGRPVLGPAEHIRDTFTRDGIVAFRSRRWSPAQRRRVRGRQPRGARRRRRARRAVRALRAAARARAVRPRPAAAAAGAGARARLQPVAPADVLPAVDRRLRSRASAPRW